MPAGEWCWKVAGKRVMYSGGSVTEHYQEVLREQDALGVYAMCPNVHDFHEAQGKGA